MAALTMVELESVIRGYHEYKRVWSPEINERLSNSHSSMQRHTCEAKGCIRVGFYSNYGFILCSLLYYKEQGMKL